MDRLMSQKSNPIWEYFSKVDSNASKAKCGACDKLLSLGSEKLSKQSVHGLKYHLETVHKELYTIRNRDVSCQRLTLRL